MTHNVCKIKIMGNEYTLRSTSSPETVQEIARMVDERMRDISSSTQTIDSLRNAVLTAITFADEVCQKKKELDEQRQAFLNREMELLNILEQAFEKPNAPHSENYGKSNPEPTL